MIALREERMSALDWLVLKHYMVWHALTAVPNVEDDMRFKALFRYFTSRGLVVS